MLPVISLIGFAQSLINRGALSFDEVARWAFARRTPFVEMWNYTLHDAFF